MPRITYEQAREVVDLLQACVDDGFALTGSPSAFAEASRRAGVGRPTLRDRVQAAERHHGLKVRPRATKPAPAVVIPPEPKEGASELLRTALAHPRTLAELCIKTGADIGTVLDMVEDLRAAGVNIHRVGDRFEIPRHTAPAFTNDGPMLELVSDEHNVFRFGAVGDNHCGSKYERRDVFADLYDRFAAKGVSRVFHTGNWIDAEASFNRHDLVAHGVDQQCKLLAETYPARPGITTYAVWGDDHEGWYAQREGIDVGSYCQNVFRQLGRQDWVDLGFMEAHVKLVNANTGASSVMSVVHPGGGSAYALSYAIQKIIESLDGGEKPAVGLYGHYHKLWSGNIRNVWCLQTGTGQDQTPFMRKKRLEAHVGGTYVEMEQDPVSGAIINFTPTLHRYFNRGFYSGRWSHHGPVTLPERSIGGL